MARANAAGTFARAKVPDKHGQWNQRLERWEPWLQYAMPLLIVVFLGVLATSAWLQARDRREEMIADAASEIELLSTVIVHDLSQTGAHELLQAPEQMQLTIHYFFHWHRK